MLEHKGFTAEITKTEDYYSATNIFYNGEKLKDILSVHAKTIEDLKIEFEGTVDVYLDWLTEE